MFVPCLAALVLTAGVDAPVTAVTVYSDRARVIRTAHVNVEGTERIELPLLLDTIDATSLRLEASGAQVQRVELAHVDAEAFPKDEARKLVDQLDVLDDQRHLLEGQRGAAQSMLNVVNQLQPVAPPVDALHPPARLDPSGWSAALGFEAAWSTRLQAMIRDENVKLQDLARQRAPLQKRAGELGAKRRAGYQVTAVVAGHGAATLHLGYVAFHARWYPVYDLALVPERSQVRVSFAALVSQESGEDWTDAALTVSTAIPASASAYPTLLTWKIGEKERFIPTPRALIEVAPPAPPVPQKRAERDPEEVQLRQRLAQAQSGNGEGRNQISSLVGDDDADTGAMSRGEAEAPAPAAAPAPPPPSRYRSAPRSQPQKTVSRSDQPAQPSAVALDERMQVSTESNSLGGAPEPRAEGFGLAPPPGYVAPRYASNLPASLAGGYDLTFASLQTETVKSGGGARRVPLFARSWPVTVERKIFPALAPEAFLVAELKNPEATALPGGQANLFVGEDPAGVAQLGFVAPGESFTLPLGLDRALKPVRNVKLVQSEKGFIGKDDVNAYVVTTELANPYPVPIAVRILDQWPVTSDAHVEIKLEETQPYATQDPLKGSLEWRMTLPAHGKTTVRFTYSIRRPKDYRLRQP